MDIEERVKRNTAEAAEVLGTLKHEDDPERFEEGLKRYIKLRQRHAYRARRALSYAEPCERTRCGRGVVVRIRFRERHGAERRVLRHSFERVRGYRGCYPFILLNAIDGRVGFAKERGEGSIC